MPKKHMENIWSICPICESHLDGDCWTSSECPKGHYEWNSRGSYAADTRIILDGMTEDFYRSGGAESPYLWYSRGKVQSERPQGARLHLAL